MVRKASSARVRRQGFVCFALALGAWLAGCKGDQRLSKYCEVLFYKGGTQRGRVMFPARKKFPIKEFCCEENTRKQSSDPHEKHSLFRANAGRHPPGVGTQAPKTRTKPRQRFGEALHFVPLEAAAVVVVTVAAAAAAAVTAGATYGGRR